MPQISSDQFGGALPTFGAEVSPTTGTTDYGTQREIAARSAAGTWDGFAAQIGAWADQSAVDVGSRAGKAAGANPNYQPDNSDETLSGIAFRNAATATYANNLEANTRQQVSDAYSSYMQLPVSQRTPDVLAANFQKIRQDNIDNHLFPDIQGQWEAAFTNLTGTYLNAARDDLDKNTQGAAQASLIANTNSASDTAHRIAAIGTPDAMSQLGPLIDAHRTLLAQQVDNGVLNAVDAQRQNDAFEQSVRSAAVIGRFNALPDAQKPAYLANFQKSYQAPSDYFAAVAQAESGGNPDAASPTSSSKGLNGFTTGTWKSVMAAHPELGLTADGRGDPVQEKKAMTAYTADNQAALTNAGIEPSDANTYMAHFLGAGGATKFIKAMDQNSAQPAASLFPQDAKANPQIFYDAGGKPRSLSEVYLLQSSKVGGATQGLSPEMYDSVAGQMQSSIRAANSQEVLARATAIHEIGAAQKAIEGGYTLPDASWNQLQQQYAASPDPNVQQAFQTAQAVRAATADFKGLPPEAIEAKIATAQAQIAKSGVAPTALQMNVIAASQNYLKNYRDEIGADPLGRAAKDGVISGLNPLPRDASQLAQAIPARLGAADQAANAYHIQPQYFTPDEKENFKAISAAGGQPAIDTAKAMALGFGPRLNDALREIGGDAPTLAGIAKLSANNGSPSFIADAAEAQRLSHDPNAKGALELPAQNNFEPIFQKTVGDALAANPGLAAAAETDARNVFGLRAFRDNLDKKIMDSTSNAAATRAIQERLGATFAGNQQYGGVADYKAPGAWFGSGSKVLAPPDMQADQVRTAIGALRDGDVKGAVAADGKTAIPASAIAAGNLVSIGAGRYWVALGDPKGTDPRYVGTQAGQRYVLDLNQLEPQLRSRVPQIYKSAAPGPQ